MYVTVPHEIPHEYLLHLLYEFFTSSKPSWCQQIVPIWSDDIDENDIKKLRKELKIPTEISDEYLSLFFPGSGLTVAEHDGRMLKNHHKITLMDIENGLIALLKNDPRQYSEIIQERISSQIGNIVIQYTIFGEEKYEAD